MIRRRGDDSGEPNIDLLDCKGYVHRNTDPWRDCMGILIYELKLDSDKVKDIPLRNKSIKILLFINHVMKCIGNEPPISKETILLAGDDKRWRPDTDSHVYLAVRY